ncbi:MAG: RsmE family RNA methyltransferase, partial [Saprospiraceae bacterium]|nr:RsmE family RNA methyltransferase [Saprospiraceae bacterium]
TEIGIHEITPLLCQRSERDTLRLDRLEKILVSAMKQSLRAWLPKLNPLTRFQVFAQKTNESQKCLAWCAQEPLPHLKYALQPHLDAVIAIGPEGDFSPEEVQIALANGFQGVSLGEARLRTETAGLMAASVFNVGNF